jgi:thiamine kinase-like enzyme
MLTINKSKLEIYLSSLFNSNVHVKYFGLLEGDKKNRKNELKKFGYGQPFEIEFEINKKIKRIVLETMKPGEYGHEHFSDRAQNLIWQNSTFNKLPKHVQSYDAGFFTKKKSLKSAGDCLEFFILTKKVEGTTYNVDLDRIKLNGKLTKIDLKRCLTLSDYLAKIHAKKKKDPNLYDRRVRELIGHGECIMGIIDGYPKNLTYISENQLKEIEKKCIDWRYSLKQNPSRLSQVHGDFHPWNILFRKGNDFTVLDRSRGEWGEPADDMTSLSINYLFYSLQMHGRLMGPFKTLFMNFWKNYLEKTGDKKILSIVQPYFAFRGLVIASPIWYPDLKTDVRKKIFNFIINVLNLANFQLEKVNSYIEGK